MTNNTRPRHAPQPARRGRAKLLVLVAAVLVALAGWILVNRDRLARQWAGYRVGAAATFDEANQRILWFEQGPDRLARLEELVSKWGEGNPRFDLFLANHLAEPACSEALRSSFATRIGHDRRLLDRWAHYWLWRAPLAPREQVASILRYHDTLSTAERPEPITWREVLDLQAVFALLGQPDRARGLSPDGWHDRYRVFRESPRESPSELTRPEQPLPDWAGPLPR